jgi:signal peptidase I
MKDFFKNLASFLQTFILALLIVIPIRFFLFQPFVVSGASMEPNFKQGEYLLIDEISYRIRSPKRGEVIVFRYPKDPSYFYIKRIIGLPGETVQINNGEVKIYNYDYPEGKVLQEPYVNPPTEGNLKIVLDKNEYFLLGDNREHSSDSRFFGSVDKKYIVGKAWVSIYPSKGIEIIRSASY